MVNTTTSNVSKTAAMLYSVLVILTSSGTIVAGQPEARWITGLWKTGDGKMAVKIDEIGKNYQGRIAWLKASAGSEAPLVDKHNPEPHLRNIPLKGNKVLRELTYNDAKKRWEGGVYYDFESGTRYNCIVEKSGPNQIKIIRFRRNPNNTETEIWHRQK